MDDVKVRTGFCSFLPHLYTVFSRVCDSAHSTPPPSPPKKNVFPRVSIRSSTHDFVHALALCHAASANRFCCQLLNSFSKCVVMFTRADRSHSEPYRTGSGSVDTGPFWNRSGMAANGSTKKQSQFWTFFDPFRTESGTPGAPQEQDFTACRCRNTVFMLCVGFLCDLKAFLNAKKNASDVSVKVDLHGTTLSHAICLQQAHDTNRFV